MESGSSYVSGMESAGEVLKDHLPIPRSDGSLAGDIIVHSRIQEDGSVCTQLELRFEDQSSALTAPEVGMDAYRHSPGRTWVLVEMAPRQGFTEPMRFSIYIPRKSPDTRRSIGDTQTAAAAVIAAREAIPAVRARCGYPNGCYYPLCHVDADGRIGQLANDGCFASVVTLEAQSLHAQGPDS